MTVVSHDLWTAIKSIAEAPLKVHRRPRAPSEVPGWGGEPARAAQTALGVRLNEIMDVEGDQTCGEGDSRNGHRERKLLTYVGTLTLGVPKPGQGSFFPEDVLTRHQRVDRALAAAVAETCATGTSARKVQKVAQ